jgi:hypothetical protein
MLSETLRAECGYYARMGVRVNMNKTKISFLILFAFIILESGYIAGTWNNKRLDVLGESSPTATPTLEPTIEPTIIPTPAVNQVENKKTPARQFNPPVPTDDPDPIGQCRTRPQCGGGITNIRKSACKAQVCCELNGKYVIFPNDQSCLDAQNASSNSSSQPAEQKNTKVPVYLTSLNSTVYCEANSVDAVKTADSVYKTAGDDKVKCMINSHSDADYSMCNTAYKSPTDIFYSVKNKFCSYFSD